MRFHSRGRIDYYEKTFESQAYGEDPFPETRNVLADEYSNLPPDEIENLLEQLGLDADELEDVMRVLGRIGRSAAGAIQGALRGGASGGTSGAIVGALSGGLSGAMGPSGVQSRPTTGSGTTPPQPAQEPPPSAPPGPAVPSQPTALGSQAAAQLLHFLFRPESLQALFQMFIGSLSRQNVQVGRTPVPAAAFVNTIKELADQTLSEHHAVAPSYETAPPKYLMDAEGEFLVDPAVPEQRAGALLNLLQQVEQQRRLSDTKRVSFSDYFEDVEDEPDLEEIEEDLFDSLDLLDAYYAADEDD